MTGSATIDGAAHLEWLRSRRSVRAFESRPVAREVLSRLIEAATTAPSNTNRQPWRFAVVTGATRRAAVVEAVRARSDEIKAIIAASHHAADFGSYSDFFWEPLASAAAIIVRMMSAAVSWLTASGSKPEPVYQNLRSTDTENVRGSPGTPVTSPSEDVMSLFDMK